MNERYDPESTGPWPRARAVHPAAAHRDPLTTGRPIWSWVQVRLSTW